MSRKCRLRSYKNIGDDGKWAADRIEELEKQLNNPVSENPVAWEWKRTHQTGGYTREVTVSHQQALDWAADSTNLSQQDTVTPLYKHTDSTELRSELQEAKEVITVQHMALEDYGITHDQQAQEIERLRKQRDTLITALDKCKFDSCNLPIDQWREVCIALANIKETK